MIKIMSMALLQKNMPRQLLPATLIVTIQQISVKLWKQQTKSSRSKEIFKMIKRTVWNKKLLTKNYVLETVISISFPRVVLITTLSWILSLVKNLTLDFTPRDKFFCSVTAVLPTNAKMHLKRSNF